MERNCNRCDKATWILWDGRPWCEEHFQQANAAAIAADEAADPDKAR